MDLVQAAAAHARDLAGGEQAPLWLHVQKVIELCEQLVPPSVPVDREALMVAAYLHDIGYATGPAPGHEQRSADMAREFLAARGLPPERVERVAQIILAHKDPVFGPAREALSLEAKILYDADKLQRAAGMTFVMMMWQEAREGTVCDFRSLLARARKAQEEVYGSLYTDRARQLASEGYRATLNYIDALCRLA